MSPYRAGTLSERFWSQVAVGHPDDCWKWQGRTFNQAGYGMFPLRPSDPWSLDKYRGIGAHRLALMLTVGDIGELFACHHCDNPPCCNPAHLYAGTAADNARDAKERGRLPRPDSCKHGHPFDEANTKVAVDGHRACRACGRELMRRYRELGGEERRAQEAARFKAWSAARMAERDARLALTTCPAGHPMTPDNVYLDRVNRRCCSACKRATVERRKRWPAKRRPTGKSPDWVPPAERTHCPKGHPYDADNTYVDPEGRRRCVTCRRERRRAKKERTGVWA